jgi:citrate/tricarballylate utilization protein
LAPSSVGSLALEPPPVLPDDLLKRGRHVMTVCNACRYCEAFCPVFPALESRVTFSKGDLTYLANLCHNCGECLYACQYAPPHEFGINVPLTLAQIRGASYEESSWPPSLSVLFKRQMLLSAVALVVGFLAVGIVARTEPGSSASGGDFYQVIPHDLMVGLFLTIWILVMTALFIGGVRFWSATSSRGMGHTTGPTDLRAFGDALTLKHLHGGGVDCPDAQDVREPWRRWFHHATFYGFALCFASTSVAAFYHLVLGWLAPYPYTSLPVTLGVLGGIGLLVGPAGLLALRRRRDVALHDTAQTGMDVSLAAFLLLTSLTGFLLLVLRDRPAMPALLIVHLAVVLALFLTLPYGKFVHGLYRTMALIKFSAEEAYGKKNGAARRG